MTKNFAARLVKLLHERIGVLQQETEALQDVLKLYYIPPVKREPRKQGKEPAPKPKRMSKQARLRISKRMKAYWANKKKGDE